MGHGSVRQTAGLSKWVLINLGFLVFFYKT